MKYCLLLCGILMSFSGFSQDVADMQASNSGVKKASVSGGIVSEADDDSDNNMFTKTGYATYYAKKFEGRKTSSGARYRGSKMTAAHLKLPFGTIVTVTNLSNGKSVELVVNDRGPHSKKYIIDVSEGAAKELGFYRKGHSKVEITYQLPEED